MLPPITTLLTGEEQFYQLPTMITTPSMETRNIKHKNVMKFSKQEDNILRALVYTYGTNWKLISDKIQTRNPRQCRERWCNYINPTLSNEPWTYSEDMLLTKKYAEYGPHWSKIAKFFTNRSDNNVKKRWKELLKRSSSKLKCISNCSL